MTEVTFALFPKCAVDGVGSSGDSFEFPGVGLPREERFTSCMAPLLESLAQRKQSTADAN